MLPDIQGFSRKPVQGRIRVPQGLHHYDVRSGQYLGDGREVPVRLRPGDAVLLASLPYRVTGVTATTSTPQVDGGAVVDCEGAIQASAGEPGRHVLHVQVLRPRGEREKLYEDVVEAPNGRFRFRLPTALNDRRGMWTLRFRDVATSSAVDVTFEIR
jgi:hypothetical protein